MNHIDWELVNWSRAQFALYSNVPLAFVPLTLELPLSSPLWKPHLCENRRWGKKSPNFG